MERGCWLRELPPADRPCPQLHLCSRPWQHARLPAPAPSSRYLGFRGRLHPAIRFKQLARLLSLGLAGTARTLCHRTRSSPQGALLANAQP